MSPHKF